MHVSIIGVGIVGNAIKKSFENKNIDVVAYDKYIQYNTFDECIKSEIMFLCLPTLYDENLKEYDKSIINDVCNDLFEMNYKGIKV